MTKNKNKNKTKYSVIAGALLCSMLPVSNAYAWDSNINPDVLDTHKMIAQQGVICVKNDSKLSEDARFKDNLDLLMKNLTSYKNGAVAPDFGTLGKDRDYSLYQDHFYDADSDKNFTSYFPYPSYEIKDTAESQGRNYMSQAIAKWKEGKTNEKAYEEAAYLLGKAMHYLADINEPHHAANVTAGIGSPHMPFEKFAEENKDKYKIDSLGYTTSQGEYALNSNYKYFTDFVTSQSQKYGKTAKDLYSSHAKMSNSWADWDYALKESLTNSQKDVASLVYSFLKEVSTDKVFEVPSQIGKFHVVISTADEKYSGTDDSIFFGMELNNGKKVEFKCDVAGDDFEQGYKTAYQFNIDDKEFKLSEVKNVWVRKDKIVGDDWKAKGLEVYIKGNKVLSKDINQWITGNYTYNIPVNGLLK